MDIDIPDKLIMDAYASDKTIKLKIVPEKESIPLLKLVLDETIIEGEPKALNLVFEISINMEQVEMFEDGKADCIGTIIINEELDEYIRSLGNSDDEVV